MEQPVLTDQNQYPTEEVIFEHIGISRTLWESFFECIHMNYPDINGEWRYYNDGKSWLMKATLKKRTVFWLSLFQDTFRITFFYTDRAEEAIKNSSISDELKNSYIDGKRFNKIRGVTLIFRNEKDIEYAKTLIALRLSIK
ncbi:MAG TPA: DUF3788 family protein [Balneolales bacterium]|nr:DUF3788 family protein [Balneolales bacterium]